MTLTLQSSSGDTIGGATAKAFSLGPDNNLVVYLDGPFTSADLLPDISVDGTSGSSCSVSPPASITALQGATLSFKINSTTTSASFSGGSDPAKSGLVVDPEPAVTSFATTTATAPNTVTGIFTWTTGGGTAPVPVGSYLAVFQATDGAHTSQLVVMININPPETVSPPAVSGPAAGTVNQSYTFTVTTPSTVTPSGDPVQYFFDWGDGNNSGWVSGTSAQHIWGATGNYSVKVQARCATHTSVVSAWSGTVSITISTIPAYLLTINITPSGGGTVSVNGQPYTSSLTFSSGTIVNLSASAAQSYNFSSWSGDTTGTSSTTTITMNGAKTVTANFTQQSTTTCQSGDLPATSRMGGAVGTWYFCVGENRPTMVIQAVGTTNETNATLTWTFPDGRVFPTDPNQGYLLGTGTSSVNLRLRGQAFGIQPNIPDAYIPAGRHRLTITGNFNGFMAAEF